MNDELIDRLRPIIHGAHNVKNCNCKAISKQVINKVEEYQNTVTLFPKVPTTKAQSYVDKNWVIVFAVYQNKPAFHLLYGYSTLCGKQDSNSIKIPPKHAIKFASLCKTCAKILND